MKFERLGNIVEILSGFAFKSSFFNENGEGLPLIRVRDVNSGFAGIYYSGEYDNLFLIKNGDLLIGLDGDFRCVEWSFGEALLNQRVCKLMPKKNLVDRNYISHFLPSALNEIHRNTNFTTVKHLSVKTINDIKIPFPPLPDQLHIANILTKAETLIVQRKESIALLDDYLKSTFLEMFYTNPETEYWNEVKFEELAEKKKASMRSGPFGSSLLHGEFTETGDVKVLGIDNVVTNRFTWKRSRCITNEKFKELKRYRVYPNDVLISIMATLGRTAVVPNDIPICINSKHLAAITLDKKIANPFFIAYAFHTHPLIVKQMSSNVKGAIMDGLNLTIIRRIKLKLPPVELQNQFGKVFEKTEALKAQYQQSLTELENLYGSLSQKAFKGELTLPKAEEQVLMAAEPEAEYGKAIQLISKKCDATETAILGGHIINLTNNEDFGRVKFQKLLHLTSYNCKLDIGANFIKKAAGPHDGQLIKGIESTLQRYRFYNIKQTNYYNHKVNYTPLNAVEELEGIYKTNFATESEQIDAFLSKFRKSTWEQCEIISTLYAVWNNRIIKNETITDELLKQDFLAWDPQKKKYKSRLDNALQWMRENEVIPNGWGKPID